MAVRGIKVGDVYEVEIKSLTQRGDGFARINGVATFVKNVNVGWKGNVKVVKVGPTYVVAEPVVSEESKE
ncbi:putative RNA-binding protein, contains TRAM domain [Candidatus Nanobsidianus stetteri]|uniref:Putative RNA-binding protein, contains TRAM domain n=1 Tax=Nanobsidianus stetteri TaxID=1294122 RepID=R1E4M8_NANST|nr:putative RNA-binding protein, contains TRAM domain [Candidatus Nanobsidianus stetteri]